MHNDLDRRSPGAVGVDDIEELHCVTRVAPIKVRIEQALFGVQSTTLPNMVGGAPAPRAIKAVRKSAVTVE